MDFELTAIPAVSRALWTMLRGDDVKSALETPVAHDLESPHANARFEMPMSAPPTPCRVRTSAALLNNTPITSTTGRYVAHAAIACRDVQEAADWYSNVIGARPVRILEDRVTFSVGGVLQLVCHLHPEFADPSPKPYPRHVGLTMLDGEDYARMKAHIESIRHPFLMNPMTRFPLNKHEHQSFMLADPSGNVIEFKWYVDSHYCY